MVGRQESYAHNDIALIRQPMLRELSKVRNPGPAATLAISKLTHELQELAMPPEWAGRRVR